MRKAQSLKAFWKMRMDYGNFDDIPHFGNVAVKSLFPSFSHWVGVRVSVGRGYVIDLYILVRVAFKFP